MSNPSYPRPQFVRREWLSLDGAWSYSFSERKHLAQVLWQGEINVPYPPESPLSGVQDYNYHPVIWYRRSFQIPPAWAGKRILLHFGAVDYSAQVWVNGRLAAEHEGGHTPFSADITDALVHGPQTLAVRAVDDPCDIEQPRGKQDWEPEPHGIWYPRTSGIWQPVWLEPVEEVSLARLRVTPDLPALAFDMEVELSAHGERPFSGLTIEASLSFMDEVFVTGSWPLDGLRFSTRLALPDPESGIQRQAWLWSPENPALFDLILTLRQGGAVLDRVESYTGLRSVGAHNSEFLLNGRPYFLQMVLDQGYWAESHLAAPSTEALRRDVELAKALGFNGVRKHQKIEDPRYLYWADHLGLLVWGELPSAYQFSSSATLRLTYEFLAMIERDYNHPCVIAWVPFNESWGIPDIRRSLQQRSFAESLYHLAKAIDPTRLVVDNDGWEHTRTDLFTIHDYENNPEVYAHRYGSPEGIEAALWRSDVDHKLALEGFSPLGLPVVLSEFGGICLDVGRGGWGYKTAATVEEFLELFAPLMKSAYGKALAGYCYTQLTDTFQEQNGLLTMDRTPKVDPAIVRGILMEGLEQRAADTIQA